MRRQRASILSKAKPTTIHVRKSFHTLPVTIQVTDRAVGTSDIRARRRGRDFLCSIHHLTAFHILVLSMMLHWKHKANISLLLEKAIRLCGLKEQNLTKEAAASAKPPAFRSQPLFLALRCTHEQALFHQLGSCWGSDKSQRSPALHHTPRLGSNWCLNPKHSKENCWLHRPFLRPLWKGALSAY